VSFAALSAFREIFVVPGRSGFGSSEHKHKRDSGRDCIRIGKPNVPCRFVRPSRYTQTQFAGRRDRKKKKEKKRKKRRKRRSHLKRFTNPKLPPGRYRRDIGRRIWLSVSSWACPDNEEKRKGTDTDFAESSCGARENGGREDAEEDLERKWKRGRDLIGEFSAFSPFGFRLALLLLSSLSISLAGFLPADGIAEYFGSISR